MFLDLFFFFAFLSLFKHFDVFLSKPDCFDQSKQCSIRLDFWGFKNNPNNNTFSQEKHISFAALNDTNETDVPRNE